MEDLQIPQESSSMSTPPSSITTVNSTNTLFPISAATTATTTTTSTTPEWLHNTSFSTDLVEISNTVPDFELELESEPELKSKPSYEFLDSRKDKRKKKHTKRKRDTDNDNDDFSYGCRKSGVRAWANSEIKPSFSKDYYFDSRGDPDNLAFGCLYRMDVVRYKHDSATRLASDVDGQGAQMKSSGRYWSPKSSALERDANLKRLRVVAPYEHLQAMPGDFVPLTQEDGNDATISEESWEDEVLRKTREFNKMTREHPQNVRVWLNFAEFQENVASRQRQKGARLQTLEKKISILENAVKLNPEDGDLVICLLKAYWNRDSADILIGKWERVLMKHPGSCRLWRVFLYVVQGDFSTFKVSQLWKMYAHAIQALCAASSKKHRQGHPSVDLTWILTLNLALLRSFLVSADLSGKQAITSWRLPYFRLK